MSDLVKICQRVIEYSFYLLFALIPLILTPWNYELFEFNKMLTVYFLTTVIAAAWIIKMIVEKKLIFRRTFWDIPLALFFLSQLASFIFSIDHHTSLFGYYSRFNGGLLSVISYSILYWAFVSNVSLQVARNALWVIFSSAVLVSGYGIAEHFGIDAQYWVQDVKNRVFSTLGQPNWLAAWLTALIPLTWGLALNLKLKIKNLKFIIYCFLFTIYYLCLLFTKSRSGFLGFVVALGIFWPAVVFLFRKNLKAILSPLIVFGSLLLVTSLFFGTPYSPSINNIKNTPSENTSPTTPPTIENQPLLISESGDIRRVVWQGALEIWRHYPMLGTGPETFAYSYYWFRPREHNDLSEWDFLYNKAHNEYLNYLATTGTIGLGSYLIIIAAFFYFSLAKIFNLKFLIFKRTTNFKIRKFGNLDNENLLKIGLLAGFASILVSNFFGFSVVPVSLLFFLFPSFAAASEGKPAFTEATDTKNSKILSWQWFGVATVSVFTLYLLFSVIQYWQADTLFASGQKFDKVGQYDQAHNVLRSATEMRPGEPIYHDELAVVAANLAVLAKQQQNTILTSQLEQMAISESDKALAISPYHLNFWKNRTKVFYTLKDIDEKYLQQALASLIKASELAPTDPKVMYNLALIYASVGQEQLALQTLQKTIELKPNYDAPHYALSLFYEQKGDKQKAKEELQYILDKINPTYQPAIDKLKTL